MDLANHMILLAAMLFIVFVLGRGAIGMICGRADESPWHLFWDTKDHIP